jgi:hypothetical protein
MGSGGPTNILFLFLLKIPVLSPNQRFKLNSNSGFEFLSLAKFNRILNVNIFHIVCLIYLFIYFSSHYFHSFAPIF